MISLVVLAGGSGTRFWPKSTSKLPKQFLKFEGSKTLLQNTLDRFNPSDSRFSEFTRSVITTEKYASQVREQVSADVEVIAEPFGRNTAPCLYWMARKLFKKDPNSIMVVMPSDHAIGDLKEFQTTLLRGIEFARHHAELITLGVTPTRPETGFGYIQVGEKINEPATYRVQQFVEKPNIEKAKEYLETKQYLWNAGMFLWNVKSFLEQFSKLAPEFVVPYEKAQGEMSAYYSAVRAESIDYALLEKSKSVVVLPLNCAWNDLGSWDSLDQYVQSVGENKVLEVQNLVSVDSKNVLIDAPGMCVALLGVKDLVVVNHNGKLLVAHKSRVQEVRKIISDLQECAPEQL